MTKYAGYRESTGEIFAFYDTAIHKEIPSPSVEISEGEWRRHINHEVTFRVDFDGHGGLYEYTPPPPSAEEVTARRKKIVSAECERRIYAVADLHSQMNLRWEIDDPQSELTAAQKQLAWDGFRWIKSMLTACREMIADDSMDWTDDALWPDAPEGLADLARLV